jgi:uncharacterized protein YkwD
MLLTPPPVSAMDVRPRARDRLFSLVNQYRRDHGLRALRQLSELNRMATRHSISMAEKLTLFHTSSLGTKLQSFQPSAWGENVGVAPRVWQVFKWWKRSAEHRANLLKGRFRYAGAGVVRHRGSFWITMIFYG